MIQPNIISGKTYNSSCSGFQYKMHILTVGVAKLKNVDRQLVCRYLGDDYDISIHLSGSKNLKTCFLPYFRCFQKMHSRQIWLNLVQCSAVS